MNDKSPQASYTPTNYKTIRSRLAGVVVVPSVVLLVMWFVFSSYTVFDGFYVRAVAISVKSASIPAVQGFVELQKERQLSMSVLDKQGGDVALLRVQQQEADQSLNTMRAAFAELSGKAPQDIVDRITALNGLLDQLPSRRLDVETGRVPRNEIYEYYNSVLDAGVALFQRQARTVPDAEAGQSGLAATEIFRAADWMSRASTLGSGALGTNQLGASDRIEFSNLVGAYRSSLTSTIPFSLQGPQEHYRNLTAGQAWKKLADLENKVIGTGGLPGVTPSDWQTVVTPVHEELISLAVRQAADGAELGLSKANREFTSVIVGSLIALLAVVIGIVLAVRISSRLVNRALVSRLTDLRKDSLKLAHERLPSIVSRLRRGEPVDVRTEVPPLDYGNDEIGQVADAFNAAQYTAVAAAVKESQAREGVNRVFLDIAHRNQGLVHRQLKILDKLEREEENPEQLDSLFQLDHLATRARRNAENLIILAGEQPGRQWRKPVRLSDILRSAVAETEQYVRVRVNPVPDRALVGVAVADTIHLIAELVDNATAFSSPRSQVQVHSSVVPHGIVVEIEDHGLGMTPEERDRANAMLAFPPEFDAMAFKGESRLGLFVVARLAAKRGIKVELRESPYGGTLALVVIPAGIVSGPATAGDVGETTQLPLRSFHEQHHGHPVPSQEGARFPGGTNRDAGADDDASRSPDPRPAEHPVMPETGLPQRVRSSTLPAPDAAEPEAPQPRSERPELPRRRKQQNLAPQLAKDDQAPSADEVPEAGTEQSAERTRRGMSAFQQGTRDARSEGAPST